MDAVSNNAMNRCRAQLVTHRIIESYDPILEQSDILGASVPRMSLRHSEIPEQNIFQSGSMGYYLNYSRARAD